MKRLQTIESPAPPVSRREFCACACQTAALLAAGTFAACGGRSTSPSSNAPQLGTVPGTVSGRTVSAAVNSAAMVQTSLGTFLLARTAQDTFSALTAVCTHEGCSVTGFASNQFVCPCHGSRFTTTGSVANGPATRALQQYTTQFANNVLTFTV